MISKSDFNHIDNKAIFYKRFHTKSFACTIARFGKFFAYTFIGIHIFAMLLETISPFSIQPPDLFFQLLFLLLLWGIIEILSIPIDACADDCIFDYQHHWISLYQNRFFYNKTTILANFNQLISIGITCKPKSIYNTLIYSTDKRYAIVIQDFSSKLIRITDYNLDLLEANEFCRIFCETHLPGTRFLEGQENQEIVLDPETRAISLMDVKASSFNIIDSITVPIFQSLIAFILTYIVFTSSFYLINFSSEHVFNTDIRIANQPVMQLLSGISNIKYDVEPIEKNKPLVVTTQSQVVKVSVPVQDQHENTSLPTLDLKNQKVIIQETIASPSTQDLKVTIIASSSISNTPTETYNTITTNKIDKQASDTSVVSKILLPIFDAITNKEVSIVNKAEKDFIEIRDTNFNPHYKIESKVSKQKKNYAKLQLSNKFNTNRINASTYNTKNNLINSSIPSFGNYQPMSRPLQESTIPTIDINIISKKIKNHDIEINKTKEILATRTILPIQSTNNENNGIPSIPSNNLPNGIKQIEDNIEEPKVVSKIISAVNNTFIEKPLKMISRIKNRKSLSRNKYIQTNSKINAILPGYGLGKLASIEELAATCINRLGSPLVKYKAKDSWQLIYSDFTLVTTIKKLEQIKRITVTKKNSKTHGLLKTPQGISVGSPISLVSAKYGPSTLIDRSPSLHYPSLGITFVPSGTNNRIVGAIEIYTVKSH